MITEFAFWATLYLLAVAGVHEWAKNLPFMDYDA